MRHDSTCRCNWCRQWQRARTRWIANAVKRADQTNEDQETGDQS